MSRLPRLTGKEIMSALKKAGFEVLRIRGSHLFSSIPMAVRLSCLCMRAKRAGQTCSPKSCETVN